MLGGLRGNINDDWEYDRFVSVRQLKPHVA